MPPPRAPASSTPCILLTDQSPRDFTLGLESPKVQQEEPRVLTKTEIKALQGVCAEDVRDAAVIEILLQMGLRVGELIALTTTQRYPPAPVAPRPGPGGTGQAQVHLVGRMMEEALEQNAL